MAARKMSKRAWIGAAVAALIALAALVLIGRYAGLLSEPEPAAGSQRAAAEAPVGAAQTPTAVSAGRAEPAERPAAEAKAAASPASERAAEPVLRPVPALQLAYQAEARDHGAGDAERRIRDIFMSQPSANLIFRDVRCTQSVCRADLRWSPELSRDYNAGLAQTMREFTRDISLDPELGADGPQMPVPMVLYVARPGHSTKALAAAQARLAAEAR